MANPFGFAHFCYKIILIIKILIVDIVYVITEVRPVFLPKIRRKSEILNTDFLSVKTISPGKYGFRGKSRIKPG